MRSGDSKRLTQSIHRGRAWTACSRCWTRVACVVRRPARMSGGGVPARTQGAREAHVSPRCASRRTTPCSMHATAIDTAIATVIATVTATTTAAAPGLPRLRLQVAEGHCKRHQHRQPYVAGSPRGRSRANACHLVNPLPRSARRRRLAAGGADPSGPVPPEGTAVEAGVSDPHSLTAVEHASRISAVSQARTSLGRTHKSAARGTQRRPHGLTE